MSFRSFRWIAAIAALACAGQGVAQEPAMAKFDHWDNVSKSARVTAAQNTSVTIVVNNTCDAFQIDVVPLPEEGKGGAVLPAAADTEVKLTDMFDCVVYPEAKSVAARYTGTANFVAEVKPKSGASEPVRAFKPNWSKQEFLDDGQKSIAKVARWLEEQANASSQKEALKKSREGSVDELTALLKKASMLEGDVKGLQTVSYFVYVNESDWTTEFGGAIAISNLVNPQFAIRDDIVVRDEQADDEQAIGLGAFVHLSNRRWGGEYWAMTFGVGVNNASDLSVFAGPSFRMGGLGFITVGYNWGKVDRLPNGQALGAAPVDGANTLNGLPKKTDSDWFIAWSYPFLGSAQSDLQKPFKPAAEKPAGQQ